MVRTERGIRGGNKRNVDREQGGRRERDGETEEGRARGRSNRSKGEGEREGRRGAEGTGVCGARSAGRGARDQWAAPGARASSSRRPCSASSGSGRGVPGAGLRAGRLCTPGAPGAALGRICTLPREAGSPAWRWPSPGASSGAPRARWIGHPRNRPTFPPPFSCRAPGPTLQARRREEARGLGRRKGPPGPRVLTPDSPRRPECRRTKPS